MEARGFALMIVALATTVYGQLIIKWRVDEAGAFPGESSERVRFLANLLIDPWVISGFVGALIAAVAYLAALTSLDVSRAYPVMALSFAIVVLASAPLYGEALTAGKVAGVVMITSGVLVATRL